MIHLKSAIDHFRLSICLWMIGRTQIKIYSLQPKKLLPEFANENCIPVTDYGAFSYKCKILPKKRILRYLWSRFSKLCLCFENDKPILEGYTNANMGGDPDSRKFTLVLLLFYRWDCLLAVIVTKMYCIINDWSKIHYHNWSL